MNRKTLTKPNGPIFGANDDVAPTSPPTQRRYTIIRRRKRGKPLFLCTRKIAT